jgi:DNA-directed RNA polymerase subunit M/transcription elongation factor TFIIS
MEYISRSPDSWKRFWMEDVESYPFISEQILSEKEAEGLYSEFICSFDEEKRIIKESVYKCKVCGTNRVETRSIQIRKSDEGETTFYVCSNAHVYR